MPAFVNVSWGRRSFAAATVLEACTPLSVRLVLVLDGISEGSGALGALGGEAAQHSYSCSSAAVRIYVKEQRVDVVVVFVAVWRLSRISLEAKAATASGGALRTVQNQAGQ